MSEHTKGPEHPTPWSDLLGYQDDGEHVHHHIISAQDFDYSRVCVNSHDALVSACERSLTRLELSPAIESDAEQHELRAAIALAKKGTTP